MNPPDVDSPLDAALSRKEQPTRLVPDWPLPPYGFVPGKFPHPVSDPRGHSFGVAPSTPETLDLEKWSTNKVYLRGFDLFNHGYYWESHVDWESLWLACGRTGVAADFLKGLIKLAAAGVKHREGKPRGVKSHVGRAGELWHGVAHSLGSKQVLFLGLQLDDLVELAERIFRKGWPEEAPLLLPLLPVK